MLDDRKARLHDREVPQIGRVVVVTDDLEIVRKSFCSMA